MSQANQTFLILGLMAASFLAQRIPAYLTALAGALCLAFLGILPMQSLFTGFSNPTLILFAGMFVIGESMFQTGLANAVGEWTVLRMGHNERRLLWGTMIITGALSTVASNTGTTAALMPVVTSICLAAGIPVSRQLMPMAFTTGYAGFSALIGTPPNMIVTEALKGDGLRPFGFFEFAWLGIPMALAGMLYMDLIGRRLLPSSSTSPAAAEPGPATLTRKPLGMWLCSAILLGVIIIMALDLKEVPLEVVAVTGAVLCVLTGCIGKKEAIQAIEWETMILFGSMFSVAIAMDKSGASARIAQGMLSMAGAGSNGYLILGSLMLITMLLGTFLSNTACAVLMAPIGLSLAKTLGASPQALVMAIAAAASCSFLTPVGTPPNLLVWEPGRYRFVDYVKVGTGLSIVCMAVSLLIIPLIWPVFPSSD